MARRPSAAASQLPGMTCAAPLAGIPTSTSRRSTSGCYRTPAPRKATVAPLSDAQIDAAIAGSRQQPEETPLPKGGLSDEQIDKALQGLDDPRVKAKSAPLATRAYAAANNLVVGAVNAAADPVAGGIIDVIKLFDPALAKTVYDRYTNEPIAQKDAIDPNAPVAYEAGRMLGEIADIAAFRGMGTSGGILGNAARGAVAGGALAGLQPSDPTGD